MVGKVSSFKIGWIEVKNSSYVKGPIVQSGHREDPGRALGHILEVPLSDLFSEKVHLNYYSVPDPSKSNLGEVKRLFYHATQDVCKDLFQDRSDKVLEWSGDPSGAPPL